MKGGPSCDFSEDDKDSLVCLKKVEFYSCPENLNVVEFQSNGLILLAG